MNSFNRRILVVDDNQGIHADFRKILSGGRSTRLDEAEAALFGEKQPARRELHFELEFASQGQEGLALVQRALQENRPYAMAFVDVRMPPGWDGIETIAKIWEVDPRLQVAICTAYSDYSLSQIAERLGENSSGFVILKKPFDTIEVTQLANAFTEKWNLFRDAQERARALEESEQRYRLLADAVPGFVWTARPDGNVDYANQQVQKYSGKNFEQIRDQGWQAFLHPDDTAKTVANWTESLQSGREYEMEYRLQRAADGAWRWHLARAQPLRNAQGVIVQWIGTATDIDDQKRAEAVLRRSQVELEKRVAERTEDLAAAHVRFEHLLRSSPAIIYSKKADGQGDATFVSHNVLAVLGHDPAEFTGQPQFWTQHVHPDDAAVLRGHRARLLIGENHSAEYRFQHRDGNWRWLRDEARVVRNAQGIPVEIVGSCTDVTDRHQMEEALRQSEERFRQIAESISEVFWMTSADWSQILYISPAYERVWGRTCASLYAQPISWLEGIHPEDRDRVRAHAKENYAGQPEGIRYRVVRPDGAIRWILDRAFPVLDTQGSVMRMVGVAQDITERKKAEEATQERLKLESQLSKLAATAPGMIYEFRMRADNSISFSYASPACKEIFGITDAELVRDAAAGFRLIHPDDLDRVNGSIQESRQTLSPWRMEFRLRHPSKGEIWAEGRSTPEREADGGVLWHGFLHDITERKQIEAALQKSENRYRDLIESQGEGVVLLDRELRFTFANPAAEKILGVWSGRLVGRCLNEFLPEREKAVLQKQTELRKTGQRSSYEIEVIAGNGERRHVLITGTPQFDPDGTFRGSFAVFRDITERKKAEEALRQSEERIRLLVASVKDHSIIMLDPDGRVASWNIGAERIKGYKAHEIVGQNFSVFYPRDEAELGKPAQALLLAASQGHVEDEGWRLRKDGTRFWASIVISAVRDEAGSLRGFSKVTRDITERRHVEDKLRLQTSALEAAANGIVITDRAGQILWVNPAFTRLTGYSAEEAIGQNPRVLKSSQNDPALYRSLWETIISGRVWDGELINRRKDGTSYTEHMTITPVRGADGEIVRHIAIKQDITDRKRAEQDLRYQKIRLESQNEASIDGILNVDANGKIIGFNGRFVEIMGIPRELMKSGDDEPVLQHVVARMKDPEAFLAKVRQLYADRNVKSQDELQFKDGRVFDRYTAPVTGEGGSYLGRIWLFRDITERKRTERERTTLEIQLRHAQKLEAVGQLAAGIAHEINTPTQYVGDNTRFLKDSFDSIRKVMEAYDQLLRAVKGNAVTPELVAQVEESLATNDLSYLFEQIPAAIRETLEGIDRVTKIVRAMKEFSHPGGKEKTPADLNKAIETTVTVARNEWKYVADMSLDLEPSLPTVPCFVGEFNQVILNLIVNAAHAIGDVVKQNPGSRGTITVKTRRDDDHVEIRVGDTGTGIPESCRPRIFEPFFTTKDVGKGTGQGLSIVYGSVVKKHGGNVSFETEVGKGTTFIIRLPITPSTVTADARSNPASTVPPPGTDRIPQSILEPPVPRAT